MPEESHFHQKMLLTLYCFLCAHCSMERPCCECHVYLAVLRQTRWGKTFPYDTQRQEIRGATPVVADGELNAFPGVIWADSVPLGWRVRGRRNTWCYCTQRPEHEGCSGVWNLHAPSQFTRHALVLTYARVPCELIWAGRPNLAFLVEGLSR